LFGTPKSDCGAIKSLALPQATSTFARSQAPISKEKLLFSKRSTLLVGTLLATSLSLGATGAVQAKTSDTTKAVPRFVVLPGKNLQDLAKGAGTGLTTWQFKYTYNGNSYSDTFVGNAPTGKKTTTPVFIIPIKIVLSTGQSFSTSTTQANGQTALADTVASPIFQSTVSFKEAGTKLGKTQYEDAFQRESFWPTVLTNSKYHVLLGQPTILPEVTLNVPKASGKIGSAFGVTVAEVDINYLDAQVNAIIKANSQITTGAVPIFELYDTYETSGGCCIGGYHSTTGQQTYAVFDYVGTPGAFSQDVSALSHEMGEWLDDPYTNNNSPCGIYEVGDPLEGESNYGGYPYTTNGMTYNLQDLAQPPYFGAPASTTLKGRATFQGTKLAVCANGS
jgi:hypothetical protein